jgi:hypothetical protein
MEVRKHPTATQPEFPGIGKEAETIDPVFDLTAAEKRPKALGIVCRRSDCERNLHCFETGDTRYVGGSCRSCGVDLIDWPTVRVRGFADVEMKSDFFDKEWIRHFFFHVPTTSRIEAYAGRHGHKGLAQVIESQLEQPKMLRFMPALDYKQTAMPDWNERALGRARDSMLLQSLHEVLAEHPPGHELKREDIEYFQQLVIRYVQFRMPNLEESPRQAATRNTVLNRMAS